MKKTFIHTQVVISLMSFTILFTSAQAAFQGPANEPCETNGTVVNSASAIQNTLTGGAKVLIRGGTYNFSTLTIPSGSVNNPTVIKPYNCEEVKINVTSNVRPQSNTVVAGLYIKQGGGGWGSAVRVSGSISNVIIRNNDLSNPNPSFVNGAVTLAVTSGPKDITMEGNFIHDCNEDCLQVKDIGPYLIKGNEFQGPVFENLLDIKTTLVDSRITDNLFHCDTLGGGCTILHGPENTDAVVTFENNLLTGCPTSVDKQLHVNGKDGVDNRYDIINNIFTATNQCRAIQFKACDGCLFNDNDFYNTTVQKGSFTGTFNLAEESGNTYHDEPYPGSTPLLNFSANPLTIQAGAGATLTWTSQNATQCTGSGGWTGSKPLSGSENVTPPLTTDYTLTCTGDTGQADQTVTVTVNPSDEEEQVIGDATFVGDSGNLTTTNREPQNLWDGDTVTEDGSTSAQDSSFYVDFDLGRLRDLTRARLFGDDRGSLVCSSWILQHRVSLQDNWTQGLTSSCAGREWFDGLLIGSARYVRVTVQGAAVGTQAFELEVYTLKGPADPSPLEAPKGLRIVK